MTIPVDVFYLLCIAIVLGALMLIYNSWYKKSERGGWYWLLLLSVVPIGIFTPCIYEVEACGVYERKVLLFPNSKYSYGMHNYVENNTDRDLFLKSIAYGETSSKDSEVSIVPGESYKVPSVELHYVFDEAPESILTNNKRSGEVRYHLSCY